MRAGDIVRFRVRPFIKPGEKRVWRYGLLIEYHTWEKIATIMHGDDIYRVPARDAELHARGSYEES